MPESTALTDAIDHGRHADRIRLDGKRLQRFGLY